MPMLITSRQLRRAYNAAVTDAYIDKRLALDKAIKCELGKVLYLFWPVGVAGNRNAWITKVNRRFNGSGYYLSHATNDVNPEFNQGRNLWKPTAKMER